MVRIGPCHYSQHRQEIPFLDSGNANASGVGTLQITDSTGNLPLLWVEKWREAGVKMIQRPGLPSAIGEEFVGEVEDLGKDCGGFEDIAGGVPATH
jgi:hypothetical protein